MTTRDKNTFRQPSTARVAFADALALVARKRPTGARATQSPALRYQPSCAERPEGAPGGAGTAGAGGGAIASAQRQMASGDLTATELVERAVLAAEKQGMALGAIVELMSDQALAEAARLDRLAASGELPLGPLHGIPITVKDIIHVAGVPTRAGSAAYCVVPDRDAVAVARARAAGAIVVAKVSTHEFALGVTTPQSANPFDDRRIPGGSSGGSAIAVACGIGLASIGTDTRASIRVPAALCGVVGLKGTYGLVPTEGIVPLSWTMDHVAPIAATVADAALMLEVMSGAAIGRLGPRVAGSTVVAVRPSGLAAGPVGLAGPSMGPGAAGLAGPSMGLGAAGLAGPSAGLGAAGLAGPLAGLAAGWRIGLAQAGFEGCEPSIAAVAMNAIRALGGATGASPRLVELDRPDRSDLDLANAAGLIVSRCEAAAFHRSLGTDRRAYWDEVIDQLDAADTVTAADYLDAQRLRAILVADLLAVFERCDVLCLPTVGITPPLRDDYTRFLTVLSRACIPWSLAGFPAVSVPCGFDSGGFPVGLQIVGPPGADHIVIAAAAQVEADAAATASVEATKHAAGSAAG